MTTDKERQEQDPQHLQTYTDRLAVCRNYMRIAAENLANASEQRPRRIAEFLTRKGIASEEDLEPEVRQRFYVTEKRYQERIRQLQEVEKTLRPPTDEDIAYRRRVDKELAALITQNTPTELPFRFHGTSYLNTVGILFSQQLSSSADRLGYETSYDVSDQVSVTTSRSVEGTVSGYTDLSAESYCLPAGCIFVLLPRSAQEESAGKSMLMGNVNFSTHPEQLFRILCSPETLPIIRQQLSDLGMNPDIAQEFFHFAQVELPALKTELAEHPEKVEQLVPYRNTQS